MKRFIWFVLIIICGVGIGLLFGWIIAPMNAAGSPLSSLRQDYRSEYVLMAAEVFHKDQDVNAAAQRIASLGTQTPAEITARAAEFARTSGYSLNDLELMNALSEALNTLPAPNGAGK